MIGYPAPAVTWRRSSGQLPLGRVHYNNSVLEISNVRKNDSDAYFCSAVNILGNVERKTLLVVVSLPVFTVKPPGKVSVFTGDTLTLNCSATGDPRPVISWKRQEAALPVGRTHRTNDALIIRDMSEEDAGNYICVATSAGVFPFEAISDVEVELVGVGKLSGFVSICHREISRSRSKIISSALKISIKCLTNCARCDWSVRAHYSFIKHAAYVTRVLDRVSARAISLAFYKRN